MIEDICDGQEEGNAMGPIPGRRSTEFLTRVIDPTKEERPNEMKTTEKNSRAEDFE